VHIACRLSVKMRASDGPAATPDRLYISVASDNYDMVFWIKQTGFAACCEALIVSRQAVVSSMTSALAYSWLERT
jgi:hypothetical protein